MKNLKEMKLTELKQLAKSLHIKDWWTKKKAQLIEEIEELQNASTEELEAVAEEDEREKATVEEYTRHWPKYTKRHNVREFLEKWRKGEIMLESEEAAINEEIEKEEQAHMEAIETIGKEELTDGELETDNSAAEEAEELEDSEEIEEAEETEELKPTLKKNNRHLKVLTFNGETKSIKEWAEEVGLNWPTLYDRVNRNGWTVEEALMIPSGQRRKKK